jgi:U3 small nucleolar RNA-associated protein 5
MAGNSKASGGSSKKASSKSRPASTSQLNTPLNQSNGTSQNFLCSFSPFNDWFASLTQSIDRHRLQVYSSSEKGQLLADYVIPTARCECLEWVQMPSSTAASSSSQPQNAKKRRKRQSQEGVNGDAHEDEISSTSANTTVLALGLSTGSIHLFNPLQGKVVRMLSDSVTSTSSSASNATSSLAFDQNASLFACFANGSVSLWDLREALDQDAATPITSTKKYNQLRELTTPYQQVAVLSTKYIALAHHSIAVYSLTDDKIVATYTGHASSVTHLIPLPSLPTRFASAAEGDRVVNIWLAPTEGRKTAKPLATLPLDAPVSHLSGFTDDAGRDLLLVVTTKGNVRLYDVPLDLGHVKVNSKKSAGIATLPLLSRVTIVAKQGDKEELPAIDALMQDSNIIKVARIAKGAKVTFDSALIRDSTGNFKADITVVRAKGGPENGDGDHLGGSAATQRYTEAGTSSTQRNTQNSTVTGVNGLLTGPDDVGLLADDQANLDAGIDDLEEPSLGQRLKGLRMGTGQNGITEEDGEEMEEDEEPRATLPMGSLSLAQTLTQALHSNDTALLSTCLAHSDPAVIRSSVTRLNGPLAVKLLEHCVDRMGRGGKRSTGALGSARTRGIIEWVRATLIAHTGYLMSLPKLVHRLSALHSTLSSRLASHERLLALNGRLELVLGQIEMRAAYTAQQALKVQGVKTKGRQDQSADQEAKKKLQIEGKQWVEESSSEEEDDPDDPEDEMDVDQDDDDEEEEDSSDEADGLEDVVRGEEEGETQDIALGNDTLGNTSMDSDEEREDAEAGEAVNGGEEGEENEEESSMEEDEEEASDESALDEEGDSDEVEDDEEEDSEEEDISRGGLLDVEAESTDGEEESEESEE